VTRRLKFSLVLGGVALGALVLLAWTQEWFSVELESGQRLGVSGGSAAPALAALALAALALAAALAIAGRVVRVVLGVIESAIGVIVVITSVGAMTDAIAASGSVISDATGVGGADSIAALVVSVGVSAWPVVAAAAGALLAAVGVAVVLTARRWPGTKRSYEAGGAGSENPWDALSDGRDPT
jgi:hypothetical protein